MYIFSMKDLVSNILRDFFPDISFYPFLYNDRFSVGIPACTLLF